jgi:hypothetical protein
VVWNRRAAHRKRTRFSTGSNAKVVSGPPQRIYGMCARRGRLTGPITDADTRGYKSIEADEPTGVNAPVLGEARRPNEAERCDRS